MQIVLATPDDLAHSLGSLLEKLRKHPRRTLLFFDDLDPGQINWHGFRRSVCGTDRYPGHVAIALVTNKTFPDNVHSRGKYIHLSRYCRDVCRSIIKGYLQLRGNDDPNLVDRIGTGYLLALGQQQIVELSPRSLISYLEDVLTGKLKIMSFSNQSFTDDLFDEAYQRDRARAKTSV